MTPCQSDPEKWFRPDGRSDPTSTNQARIKCLRECPLAQQRICAATATTVNAKHGVWAGVELPGMYPKDQATLESRRRSLKAIAAGRINARQLRYNQQLLLHYERHLKGKKTCA